MISLWFDGVTYWLEYFLSQIPQMLYLLRKHWVICSPRVCGLSANHRVSVSASVSQLDRQYLVVAEEPNLWMETKYFSGNLKLILTKFIVISTFFIRFILNKMKSVLWTNSCIHINSHLCLRMTHSEMRVKSPSEVIYILNMTSIYKKASCYLFFPPFSSCPTTYDEVRKRQESKWDVLASNLMLKWCQWNDVLPTASQTVLLRLH